MKLLTQKNIADLLGISRATVSRALNGSDEIKEETKAKILALSKGLGYEVNPHARNLARKSVYKIKAYLIDPIQKDYLNQVYKGIERAIEKNTQFKIEISYNITKTTEYESQLKAIENDMELFEQLDAVIIMPIEKLKLAEMIKKRKLNKKAPIYILGLDINNRLRKQYVGCNHVQSGRLVANVLNETVSKDEKILVVNTIDDYISSMQRMDGFLEVIDNPDRIIRIKSPLQAKEKLRETVINLEVKYIYSQILTSTLLDKLDDLNIKIICHENNQDIKQAMENKKVFCSINENPYIQGYVITERLIDHVMLKKTIKSDILSIRNEINFLHSKEDYWI